MASGSDEVGERKRARPEWKPICRGNYFLRGDIVWVRPKGFPFWPAEVRSACKGLDPSDPLTDDADVADPHRQSSRYFECSLFFPPTPSCAVGRFAGTTMHFFDRLETPEAVASVLEEHLQRDKFDVSAYEATYNRAVLHANTLVRSIFNPTRALQSVVVESRPVGVVYSLFRTHHSAPRQPHADGREVPHTGIIRMAPCFNTAVRDLKGFERIWVLFFFSYALSDTEEEIRLLADRAPSTATATGGDPTPPRLHKTMTAGVPGDQVPRGYRNLIVPPRDTVARGVFATRSPHRPNGIGLSCVRLVDVRGLDLHIADHDLLHGTPVLDVKPYLPFCDSHPDAKHGWVEALDASGNAKGDHKVSATVRTAPPASRRADSAP